MKLQTKSVFKKGVGNADYYRIPSIISTKNGTVIAVCDERYYSNADNPNKINKVMRRSFDNGHSWENLRVIVEEKGDTQLSSSAAIDPCLLYDDINNLIYLLYSHTPPGIGLYNSERSVGGIEGNKEIPTSYLMLCSSDDDGETWSEPICLNPMVKDPKWGFIGPGPGIGICLKNSRYRGRLVFPIYYGANKIQPSLMACIIYSDDGKNWKRSGPMMEYQSGVNDGVFESGEWQLTESQIVEQENGNLLAFIRNHHHSKRILTAVSSDGGRTWKDQKFLDELVQPICQISALKFYHFGKPYIAVVNPADENQRLNGTIRLSEDDGKTFPYQKVIKPGQFIYNSVVYLPDKEIGILYEPDWQSIEFIKVKVEWIKGEE